MYIGPKKTVSKKNPEALFQLIDNGWEGVWGWSGYAIETEATDFVLDMCKRFNIPMNADVIPLISFCEERVLEYTDWINPYSTLFELSDLALSNDWEQNTYEILENKKCIAVADPDEIETYVFVPGQAEKWFDYFLSHPGIDNIPYGIANELSIHLLDSFDKCDYKEAADFCKTNLEAYLKMFAWSSFIWLCGPLGRSFRQKFSLLHEVALEFGEGILYHDSVLSPQNYNKLPRPYTACSSCGIDAYCTDILGFEGGFKRLCERCAHQGRIIFDGANCGTRLCKYVECPHHPYAGYANRNEALYQTLRSRGILAKPKSNLLAG